MKTELRDSVGAIAAEWDALVDRQRLPSPFLASWWIDNIEHDRAVLAVTERGHLIGGAAFAVRRLTPGGPELVTTVGQGPLAPDHIDLIAESGRAAEVGREVLLWLHRPGNRVVDLDGLAAGGTLGRALRHDVISTVGAPYAELPATGAEYLSARPGALRSTIRRTRKRLEKDGTVHEVVGGPDRSAMADIDRALDALHDLHDGRWAEDSAFLSNWDDVRRAARVGLEQGRCAVHLLRGTDGTVGAVELDLLAGSRVAFYQAGRNTEREWRGAGSALRSGIVEAACDDGATEYDLLRGDEDYKADWADHRRELVRVRFGVGASGVAAATTLAAWRRAAPHVGELTRAVSRRGR